MRHWIMEKEQGIRLLDRKTQSEYVIPAAQQKTAMLLQGKHFAAIAISAIMVGIHVPYTFCAIAGGLSYFVLRVYEHRIFLPQLTVRPLAPNEVSYNRETIIKKLLADGFVFLFALLMSIQKATEQRDAVVFCLGIGVMVLSLLHILRLLLTYRKRRVL